MKRSLSLALSLLGLACQVFGQEEAKKTPPLQKPLSVPLEVRVPVPPTAVKAGGKTHLAYELHVTNISREECVLTRVEVNGRNQTMLARYEGDELTSRIERLGAPTPTSAESARIGGGLRAIVYLWLTVETEVAVPAALQHRLSVKVGAWPEALTLDCARVAVKRAPITISPPLRGDGWLAADGPSNTSEHRRELIPVGGGTYNPQRFAIDWRQLREDGKTFTGDRLDNKNYRCYGAEVLAVADATVVGVKDGIPENVPGATSPAVPITLETIGGNYVFLNLGRGHYAFYAHLQPSRILVKVGDKVRRGQVLGYVGNSGNSTGPHLHFHISDANSPLGSDGLPYVFSYFEVLGKGTDWKATEAKAPAEKRANEMPLENEVVRFPARQ